jgi:hypothetical protein
MGFETAAHNALREVFPEWAIKTCLFHFVKSVTSQVEKKVHASIRTQDEFKKWLNQILGMLFCHTFLSFDSRIRVFANQLDSPSFSVFAEQFAARWKY